MTEPGFQVKAIKPSLLERFGMYYMNLFSKGSFPHTAFDFTDPQLRKEVNRITGKGILLSAIVGVVFVWPMVYVDLLFAAEPWYIHYGWLALVTVVGILFEFYFLFLIALKAVHELSQLVNIHASPSDLLAQGPFNVSNVLARAALELPDPEMEILGIDPFQRISKRNLLLLGLIYKAKIVLTNVLLKWLLGFFFGPVIGGISILYVALPVECFWNGMVLRRVVKEARLRLFGFALCHHIVDRVEEEGLVSSLSATAKTGCLRAIGNAVVMTQNYHPNMVILLLRFQQLLQLEDPAKLDDWGAFLDNLTVVTPSERNFILDVFTIAASFDGKLSDLESQHLSEAYQADYHLYKSRLTNLTEHLREGRLHAAAALCLVDFKAG